MLDTFIEGLGEHSTTTTTTTNTDPNRENDYNRAKRTPRRVSPVRTTDPTITTAVVPISKTPVEVAQTVRQFGYQSTPLTRQSRRIASKKK